MSGVLITGTDTGVGKTVICRYLAAYLRARGLNVTTQKWVQTGCPSSDDIELHSVTASDELAELRVPYRLKYPASPHLAAAIENVSIDIARIENAYVELARRFEMVLVEGCGGALVPLTDTVLLADVAARLNMPAIVVVHNRLGCINHALLTIEALRSRGLKIVGLVFNRLAGEGDETILADNIRITGMLSGAAVLGELPYLAEPGGEAGLFDPIGEAFCREWRKIADE